MSQSQPTLPCPPTFAQMLWTSSGSGQPREFLQCSGPQPHLFQRYLIPSLEEVGYLLSKFVLWGSPPFLGYSLGLS